MSETDIFFEKLFKDKDIFIDLNTVFLINKYSFNIARLFTYYYSLLNKSNTLLLPKEFLNPELSFFNLSKNQKISISEFIRFLENFSFQRVDRIYDVNQYILKGDVITLSFINFAFRIVFFDNFVENIYLIDSTNYRVIKEVKNLTIPNFLPNTFSFIPELFGDFDSYSNKHFIFSDDPDSYYFLNNLDNAYSTKGSLILRNLPLFLGNKKLLLDFIDKKQDYSKFYLGRFSSNLDAFLNVNLIQLNLPFDFDSGFIEESSKIILFTDYELFGSLFLDKYKKNNYSKFQKFFENKINVGDFVVHEAHGIGIYRGIEKKVVLGEEKEFVIIEYRDGDKLLVPFNQLHRVSKYISSDIEIPKLTKLGTPEWDIIKKKLKKNVEQVAKELLEIYAKRNIQKGIEFLPDNQVQLEFELSCPFELTEDQVKTLNEVKNDMESPKPMDRLIIGDVGFGKTEIALRASLKAVLSKNQVLIIAPTTILATQLYNVFIKRFSNFPISIRRVTRFDGVNNNKNSINLANKGLVDILIGTHRLLSNDVNLPNLGLLIIDEEQRFGVRQKEKIRKIRPNIDVLSMSATPIPRTLQMALTGIKDISIISTPPKNRLPVINELIFDEEIPEKVIKEINRDGQVFIVHNHIETLDAFVLSLRNNLPSDIKIAVAHGRIKSSKLEKIIFDFINKNYSVLVSTTIIENGIDIPNVNTIIIHNAHEFGLSQLYQLRGRVGRSNIQGYCYLVVPKIKEFINLHKNPSQFYLYLKKVLDENKIDKSWVTEEAISRIKTILENQNLGSGFNIASRDLEIRGTGNLLGTEQSGHINAVGYEMYIRLLEQEIDKLKRINGN